MSSAFDEEILADFLLEGGEIHEQLAEQLVQLEREPDNLDLLNAIFRAFHTIKGGAGFLSVDPMVDLCHRAEDIFNVLRQGEQTVTSDMMDAVLQALDDVGVMFDALRVREMPAQADPKLLERLSQFAAGEVPQQTQATEPTAKTTLLSAEPAPPVEPPVASPQASVVPSGLDGLMAELQMETETQTEPAAEMPESDDITEEEFEALLDQLHGPGKHGGQPTEISGMEPPGDDISEEEFEALLDQLHGKGKHGGVPSAGAANADDTPPASAEPTKPAESKVDQAPAQPAASPAKPAMPAPPPPAKSEPTARATQAPVSEKGKPEPPVRGTSTKDAPAKSTTTEATVRVDTHRLDKIMNLVGELVLVRNRLYTLRDKMNEHVGDAVNNLDVVTADLQLAVMKTRMQPVKKVFGRFPRVVRDLARQLNKEVELELHGEDTDLDKNLVEALADPLVHLVRNAVDHGIEDPQTREEAGKPRAGLVVLSAAQEGDHIQLSIEDDGAGMDPEVLRRKAVEKGIMDESSAERLDEQECYQLIMHPGFSTKTEISDVSGRGVGMDVVKTKLSQMNGAVEIYSSRGEGTKIAIKLPLTLAILPTLMVQLGGQAFALPLASVVEIFRLDADRTNKVDGQLMVRLREHAIPLYYLHQWLTPSRPQSAQEEGHVVVVNAGSMRVGLVVDFLVGQEEVVIKPLGTLLHGVEGMAGATITGDGKIALILDVPGLLSRYARRM